MNLASLKSSDLKRIGKLLAERETLTGRLAQLDQQLAAFEGGQPRPAAPPSARPAPKAAPARAGKRRKLKEMIIEILQKAGAKGATVKDIAESIGVHPNRIYTWFYNTGNRLKPLKKIGPAVYRWES